MLRPAKLTPEERGLSRLAVIPNARDIRAREAQEQFSALPVKLYVKHYVDGDIVWEAWG